MNSKKNTTNGTLDQREADHAINNYTRVPNMLVDGYPELHPQDKWLFVCLVRLCGKEGTRHLSLRYIGERTGFSPSVLSDSKGKPGMLKRLHSAGLIHAEIKRKKKADGKEEKNAQYHITIADTWKLNYDFFHPETCSDSERDATAPVLNPNATRSKTERDNLQPVRIQNETCSDSGAIVRLQDKITDSNKITGSKNGATQQKSSTPETSFSHSSTQSSSLSEIVFTEEENAVYELAKAKRLSHLKRDENHKSYCAELVKEGVTSLEKIESLMQFCHQRSWLAGKDLNLKNLLNELNSWLQVQPPTPEPEQVVTDADIAAMVSAWSHLYKDSEHAVEHQQEVARIHREYDMDNSAFFDMLHDTKEDTDYSGSKSMNSFFRMLEIRLRGKRKKAAQAC